MSIRNLAITLICSLAVLLALTRPSSASAVSLDSPHRRDHVNLNRMIKIRVPSIPRQHNPSDQAGAVGPVANPSTGGLSSPVPSSTSSASSDTSQPSSTSPASQPTSSLPLSVSSSAASSGLSTSSQSSVSSTSSTTPTSTTTSLTPSTTSSSSTSSTPASSTQENKPFSIGNNPSASVDSVTLTSHVAAPTSTSADNAQIGGSSISHSAITILIIIAASVGGCAIIWTIIRKWKFRPSAQFEDRLEPVNWQPAEHDSGLPTHRRVPSNASSFHSAGHENMGGLSRSDSGAGYNAGRSLTPLPEHDFTAGASGFAPVGGYADLARGPSPQPQMQEALQYGPSVNRGYENYLGPAPQIQGSYGEAYDHNNVGAGY